MAGYRTSLTESRRVPGNSSTLFVVGRKDTGALEAQIRGSRYAWDMRVVGADSLVKLMRIAVKSNEPSTIRQIRELLRPFEYTRVDRIVDVVFDTATDVEQSSDASEVAPVGPSAQSSDYDGGVSRTATGEMNEKRSQIVAALQFRLGVPLVQRRRAYFESADGATRVCITISKRYYRDYQPYWYAYHPAWNEFLLEAQRGFFVLGCMDREDAFVLPVSDLAPLLPKLNKTIREDGKSYWHVSMTTLEDGSLALYSSKTGDTIPLAPYALSLKSL